MPGEDGDVLFVAQSRSGKVILQIVREGHSAAITLSVEAARRLAREVETGARAADSGLN